MKALIVTAIVLSACASGVLGVDSKGPRYVAGQVLVAWRDQGDRQSRVSVVETDRDVLSLCDEFKKDPAVAWAQPNYRYHPCQQPNDPDFPDQYAHQLIEMSQAWEISTGSRDVVIAILGSGVEIDHPDLEDNIWINYGEVPGNRKDDDGNGYVDDVHGWNFENANSDVTPGVDWYYGGVDGHETMVAGVIGAVGNNDQGVTGVNWQCSIMVLRLSLDYTSSEIAAALKYAADNGARVVNMSFGGTGLGPDDD
jgi:subtilisin family serine protease